jgi:Ca2+-binding RTX toxin-like protein
LFGKSGLDTPLGGEGDDRIESNGGQALLLGEQKNDTFQAFNAIDIKDISGFPIEEISNGETEMNMQNSPAIESLTNKALCKNNLNKLPKS